jgi:hypothetical protein
VPEAKEAAVPRILARAAAVVLVAAVLTACDTAGNGGPAATAPPPSVWRLPADPKAAAERAGLQMLDREMLDVHYHAHLDVVVRGVRVTVPAGVGIDAERHLISPLHTHDPTGIVHIESAADIPFTLGQFFTEWGQPLSTTQIGPVTVAEGEQLRVYRNGKVISGDPKSLKFTAHAEIVVWVGPARDQPNVPSSFDFPEGL